MTAEQEATPTRREQAEETENFFLLTPLAPVEIGLFVFLLGCATGFVPVVMRSDWSFVLMPPPGAGKQPDGDEEEQKAVARFVRFKYQNKQNNSDQYGNSGRQVMNTEVIEEVFNIVEVHNGLVTCVYGVEWVASADPRRSAPPWKWRTRSIA